MDRPTISAGASTSANASSARSAIVRRGGSPFSSPVPRLSKVIASRSSSGSTSRQAQAPWPSPAMRSSGALSSVQPLDEHRHSLPAADAHRLEADRRVQRVEVVEQGAHDPGAGHAVRVAERDRAAVRVELLAERVDTELATDRE